MSARWDYRPLPGRAHGRWPDGARVALIVCVGVESYRDSGGETEDILPGVAEPDLVNRAWRDYGNRVGGFRLFDQLGRLGVPPTVLLNTDVYAEAPELLVAARAVGAELVGHGRSNSDILSGLAEPDERAYLADVRGRIETAEGLPPGGWSSPWLTHTDRTVDLLAETGYRYLLDLRLDDQPVWLRTRTTPVLALPYAAELNDSSTMIGRQASATDFAQMITDEFGVLWEAAADVPLVMSVVLHSFISGTPFRLGPVVEALAKIAGHAGVWCATPAQVYAAVEAAPEIFGPAPGAETPARSADRSGDRS